MAYVYLHRKPDTTIFYVGKGTGNRKDIARRRNRHWNYVAKDGFTSEILMDGLNDEEAFELEELICEEIGYENLTNAAPAGLGGVGKMKPWNKGTKGLSTGGRPKGSKNRHPVTRKSTINTYINTETGVVFSRMQDAADSVGLKMNTLRAMLDGVNPNKTNIIKRPLK